VSVGDLQTLLVTPLSHMSFCLVCLADGRRRGADNERMVKGTPGTVLPSGASLVETPRCRR
jgi:hypothetical protein